MLTKYCQKQIWQHLSDLNKWFNVNKLCLNIDKTRYTVFAVTDCDKNSTKLKLNDFELQQVESIKYLGIIIESHLTWFSVSLPVYFTRLEMIDLMR